MEKKQTSMTRLVAADGSLLADVEEKVFVREVCTSEERAIQWHEVSIEHAKERMDEQRGEEPVQESPVEDMPAAIDMAKAAKIAEIAAYSDSEAVNSLTFNGLKTWLTPNVRANYLVSLDAAELLGETDITFVVEGVQASLPIKQVRLLLAKIQRYADACYIVTEGHKRAVKALQTVEEVESYDYTTGYPEKLSL